MIEIENQPELPSSLRIGEQFQVFPELQDPTQPVDTKAQLLWAHLPPLHITSDDLSSLKEIVSPSHHELLDETVQKYPDGIMLEVAVRAAKSNHGARYTISPGSNEGVEIATQEPITNETRRALVSAKDSQQLPRDQFPYVLIASLRNDLLWEDDEHGSFNLSEIGKLLANVIGFNLRGVAETNDGEIQGIALRGVHAMSAYGNSMALETDMFYPVDGGAFPVSLENTKHTILRTEGYDLAVNVQILRSLRGSFTFLPFAFNHLPLNTINKLQQLKDDGSTQEDDNL